MLAIENEIASKKLYNLLFVRPLCGSSRKWNGVFFFLIAIAARDPQGKSEQ